MFNKKYPKGTYGYVDARKKIELIWSAIYFALPIGLFLIGLISTKTRINLLTVVAIVSVLPAAKKLTTTIMLCRFRTGSQSFYEKAQAATGKLTAAYDLALTTYDNKLYINAVVLTGHNVILYSETQKDNQSYFEKFLKDILSNNSHGSYTVKLFTDEAQFLNRVKGMAENFQEENKKKEEACLNTIKACCL